MCGTCPLRLPKQKVAKKQTISSFFRDRFQADLVDFTNNIGIGANSVVYKWLLTLKDQFTRLSYWCALRGKTEEEVFQEFCLILGYWVYPLDFHTDNVGEQMADMIIKIIRDIHSDCSTIWIATEWKRTGFCWRSHIPCKDDLLHMVQMYKSSNPHSSFTHGVCQ